MSTQEFLESPTPAIEKFVFAHITRAEFEIKVYAAGFDNCPDDVLKQARFIENVLLETAIEFITD